MSPCEKGVVGAGQYLLTFGNIKTRPVLLLYGRSMNRHRFAPVGDLDTAEVDALRLGMLQAIGDEPALVTLDVTNAGFVGAAFLGLLAELRQLLEANGGALAIMGANAATVRIMILCDMGHLLARGGTSRPDTIVLPDHVLSLDADFQNESR